MAGNGSRIVIAHLSDLHLGAHDPAAVASIAADVAAAAPTLTVVTGDLTMRARPWQFRLARNLLDRLPQPLLVVSGNHDLPLVGLERLLAPYRRFRLLVRTELDPVRRLSGLTALGLQTTPPWRWKSGRVTRRQSDTVVAVLGSAPAGAVRVLAVHHPPRAAGLARLAGHDRLMRALGSAGVDLILAGHTHVPAAGTLELKGTAHRPVEVVAGTAVSRRTRGTGRSWTAIRVDEAAITVEERQQNAAGWCAGAVRRFPRAP
ncbi:metallophosphoesterase family protein [Pseudosporangium ferrugineum]|uniref:3',5'-cyclic AMP phosphodiesterase CpdA n=1 Tax=Pseudosporangium ferrugineum TaxID=439699 RepID=A0A2T0SBP5_9ACTN|nr:metallophosphoesterase [Pseudosporangium ferrugineum]PRY30838.1 3',5'-cyclic AMP phosphodiesterase CpdA [Pseudosporangium ferrugineum]